MCLCNIIYVYNNYVYMYIDRVPCFTHLHADQFWRPLPVELGSGFSFVDTFNWLGRES